jgi:CheY-like chemotaxis protein
MFVGSGKVLVAVQDLFFVSKISETLKKMGLQALFAATPREIDKTLKENDVALMIVDLSMDIIDVVALVGNMKNTPSTSSIPIIGFGEHTDIERLQGAQEAGCDVVVSNRKFVGSMKALVEAWMLEEDLESDNNDCTNEIL